MEIAESEGFSTSDVAFLTGLSKSTISRLWHDPNWLEHVSGKTTVALTALLPGLADYFKALDDACAVRSQIRRPSL
jgi:transcriptional regulator with XRE-family HTH domain